MPASRTEGESGWFYTGYKLEIPANMRVGLRCLLVLMCGNGRPSRIVPTNGGRRRPDRFENRGPLYPTCMAPLQRWLSTTPCISPETESEAHGSGWRQILCVVHRWQRVIRTVRSILDRASQENPRNERTEIALSELEKP